LLGVKPVLTLFAHALAGHAVALREDVAAGGARSGSAASSIEITLPPQIAWFAAERDNRAAYRTLVMRHLVAGHDDPSLRALCVDRPPSWRRVFRSLERLRVDTAIARTYAGARADLARQRAHELAQRTLSPPRRGPLMRALDALSRSALGDDAVLAAAIADDTLVHAMLRHAATLADANAVPLDSARIASLVCELLGGRADNPHRADAGASNAAADQLATAGASASDGNEMPALRSVPDGPALATAQGQGATAGGTIARDMHRVAATASAPPTRRAAHTRPRETPHGATASSAQLADDAPASDSFAIDEWDYRQQRLLLGWCTLNERRADGSDTAFIHSVRRRHAELAHRVRRQFAAWRPEGLQRVHGASDGDELELDRLIEAMVDRRAGLLDDRAWYVRRDRARRDVATAFLLDTSASTDFVLPDALVGPPRPAPSVQADVVYLYDLALSGAPPEPPKRRVIDVAQEALALMCDALHTLGDCFAVYAFSGHGRAQVDFRIVKSFDEPVSSRTAGAIAALRPHGATRTGAAIRHACARLVRQSQRRRTLIVVTDGYPEDIDYGPEPRDLRYGIEDTAHALQEAQASGVQTFCLSIDPAGHDYLRRMCPPQRYLVIGEVAALPGELVKVYRAMTRATHHA